MGWLVVSLRRLAEVRDNFTHGTANLVRPGHPFALCFTLSSVFQLPSTAFPLSFQISPGEYAAGMAMRRLTNVFDYAGGSLGTLGP